MKAISVKEAGSADRLQLVDIERPTPGAGELLVQVQAAAVNRTDIISRERGTHNLPHAVLGVELAGNVVETGEGCHTAPGTRVMGLVNGGGYAEYALLREDRAMHIPDSMSFAEAAAIPEVFLTAWQTLFWIGRLRKNETVLIHAGGSGVGTAAIQLARQIADAKIITTAGSAAKLEMARALGADIVINYKEKDFGEEVHQATQNRGVDLILDFIGSSYWENNLHSIAMDGRWVLIGTLGGSAVETFRISDLMIKRIQMTGTLLTPRSDAYKAELTAEFTAQALPLFSEGRLRPVIDRVLPLEMAREAHLHMENDRNIGKIILSLNGSQVSGL